MRPLKRWRYVGAYGPEVMACVGDARIGPFRQRFWAVCEPGRGVVDDTEGRHARHTTWTWSAGVGRAADGSRVGWNLVTGVNDEPTGSERCVWLDGAPREVGPVEFAADLSRVSFSEGGALDFDSWGSREDDTNLLLLRSSYRQPFGTFGGSLPGGVILAEGYGVMEWHDVWW